MIPELLLSDIQQTINAITGTPTKVISLDAVSGGDINQAFRVRTQSGLYFLKYNDAVRFPGMFETEALGLKLLKRLNAPRVPKALAHGESENHSWLLLEFIEQGSYGKNFWDGFGLLLAQLHKNSNESFGLDHDNYIGSLPQSNKKHTTWNEFFIEERLEKQLEMARNKGLVDNNLMRSFNRLFKEIPSIFPSEPPALVHGDLWSGNFMCDANGNPCIIDPAVYFGFREMDIAMSKLFSGFESHFYEAYHDAFPMAPGWQSRIEICNLYPLLVHVNLFGGGYLGSVKSVVTRY
ncbi:MAG: fructosamine kinase family protein [Bacteroidales bacterium]|nr:fructosamine kinase family protein [Bacteroidales bacterium]